MEPMILASSSPRRQEILKMLNIPYKVIIPNIKEIIPEDISLQAAPEYLAARKVDAVARSLPAANELPWILGADTLIVAEGKVLGKPKSQDEAREDLQLLQGKTHDVYTGLALFNGKLMYIDTRTAHTRVTFAPMSEDEINWYLETGDWHGVAGGYRIQGLASCFITKIEGTNSAVVGLPIFELYDMLKTQNYSLLV